MSTIKYYADWLFKDMHGRHGKYIIAEVPNLPLIVFMVSMGLGIIMYPGPFQTFLILTAYVAFFLWGIMEFRGGRSRFRKIIGFLAIVSVILAVIWHSFG